MKSKYVVVLLVIVLLMTLTTSAYAYGHDPADEDSRTFSEVERQRLSGAGAGMPSIDASNADAMNMDFLGQLTNDELGVGRLINTGASFLSDIWGWTSPRTGDEYIIVGTSFGAAFVNVEDPTDPLYLGTIPTINQNTQLNWWWDIKTYGDYAYIVTEVSNTGVLIFDMSRLDGMPAVTPGTPEAELTADAVYNSNGYVAAHNISINEDSGFAYLTGVTQAGLTPAGGTVILDLSTPLAPSQAGVIDAESHDAQIVTYDGPDTDWQGKEIAFVFAGTQEELEIYDATDKGNIMEISATTYPGASYTHQGWLTEDHSYVLLGDEEDELFGISDPQNPDLPDTARTYVFDVQDLDNPAVIGAFDSPEASIDHNMFALGDRLYQANYVAGIRVLDLSDVANGNLTEVAYMDTEPRFSTQNENWGYNIWVGTWGVYPFFESGTIAASDGLNGLVLMRLAE